MKQILSRVILCLVIVALPWIHTKSQNAGMVIRGTTMVIAASINVLVPGNVRVYSSGDYILNNGAISISGDFTNGGNSFDAAGIGTEIFNGTTIINGSINSVFNNFKILPGSTVTLAKSIDIKNDWINNGKFVHGNNIVTFSGIIPVQYLFGSGTFYDLKLQNAVHFTSSQDTIENSFSNSATGMVDGTSRVVFKNNSSLIGNKAKYFYDLEVLSGANVTHTTGPSNIHVAHSFINNGISFTEDPSYTFYFDSSLSVAETMSGTGLTTFGNLGIGFSTLTGGVSLNTGTTNYVIAGDSIKFKSTNSSLVSSGTVTFNKNVAGTISILNASSVSGTSASFYNANINTLTSTSATSLNPGISGLSTFLNTLVINPSGSVVTNIPNYGGSSTLIYNSTTSPFINGAEWNSNNATAGLGVPQNVSVTNTNAVVLQGSRTVLGILNLTAGRLDINVNNTLTVTGGFTGTGGYLKGSPSSNLIAGGTGTIKFDTLANYLKTLTISTSANLLIGDSLNIAGGTLASPGTVTATGTVDANGKLFLKSDVNGTARVGFSTGTINGEATVERYIPAKRAWRFMSVPFRSSSQTIRDAWQEGVNNYQLGLATNLNPHPGFGTHITGDNISTKGYDLNTTTNPSIKIWDAVNNIWDVNEPQTISANIAASDAYYLFVRGSRAVDLSQGQYAGTDPTVLRMKGTLNQVTANPVLKSYTGTPGNFILVGNPYASSIDISSLLSTSGIQPQKFYVWDPKLSNTAWGTVGAYVTYSNGTMTPNPGGYGTGSYPVPTTIMQGEQGFMFQLTSASNSTSLTFNETDKTPSESNVFGLQAPQSNKHKAYPTIYTNLLINSGDSLVLTDGVATSFSNQFSEAVDESDAQKFWGYYENIAEVRSGQNLAIEFRPVAKLTDTIFYRLYLRQIPYSLQIFSQALKTELPARAWLVDKYLNSKIEINVYDTTFYSFTPNADTTSYRNRFMLVFNRQLETTPIPVSKIANQSGPHVTGVDNDLDTHIESVSIYPNPALVNEKVLLQFSNISEGNYEISVCNFKGQKLFKTETLLTNGNNIYSLTLIKGWSAGVYTIVITNKATRKTKNLQLVINK